MHQLPRARRVLRRSALTLCLMSALACSKVQDLGEDRDGGPGKQASDAASAGDSDRASDGDDEGAADGDGDGGSPSDGDDGAGDDDGVIKPPDLTPVAVGTREVCDLLLACADQQVPSQFSDFFPIYGSNGSCFAERADAECRESCVEALTMQHELGAGPCGYCESDDVCTGATVDFRERRCHPRTHRCVECLADADCQDSDRPYCDPESFTCKKCTSDAHCENPECGVDIPKCEFYGCDPYSFETAPLTLRGVGLDIYEGQLVQYRLSYLMDESSCGRSLYYTDAEDEPKITNGEFVIMRDDYVPTPSILTLWLHNFPEMKLYETALRVEPKGSEPVVVEVRPSDLHPAM